MTNIGPRRLFARSQFTTASDAVGPVLSPPKFEQLQTLSGSYTPRESMPEVVQWVMLATPNTHFVMLAQAILYRGAGISAVWPQFLSLAVIGTALFVPSLARFRRTIGTMA